MVIRSSQPKPRNTPAQNRRQAQRQLARDLKAGRQILPSKITSKAKAVSSENKKLADQIQAIKKAYYGDRPSWNAKRSRQAIVRDEDTGKIRSLSDLHRVLAYMQRTDDLDSAYTDEDVPDDIESALHYH